MLGCRVVPASCVVTDRMFLQWRFGFCFLLYVPLPPFLPVSNSKAVFSSLCLNHKQVQRTIVDLDLKFAILVTGEQRSAVVNDTILYLPYCTGDLHMGQKFRFCAVLPIQYPPLAAAL